MRWAIVGLATACAVGGGILLYSRIATTTRDDAQDWRQSELAFLKSVHDRIQVDLAFQSAGGAASLRREDDTILRAMAAVAKQMPADSVPNDIRVLLPASDLPEEDAQAAPIEPVAAVRSVGAATRPTGEGSTATPPPTVAVGSEPSSPEAPPEPVVREASLSSRPPKPPLPAPDAPRTLPQLEAALHAEKTDRGLRVILPADALFGAARDALDPAADPTLSNLAELIEAMQPREIVVIGHTDSSVENDANPALSKKRAHAVAAWLAAHGPPEHQPHFVERGYARTQPPVAPNDNADGSDNTDGRQQKRRIEILLRRN